MRTLGVPHAVLIALALFPAVSTSADTLALPPDSARWELEGQAKATEYLGRKALLLDGGAASVKDFTLRDGIVDFDVATPGKRGFLGVEFRVSPDGGDAEFIYLRPHKSGEPDALQYTPVLQTGLNWQLYNGPGFTAPVDIPRETWFHVRLVVTGAQAKLFVTDMQTPALIMDDLKTGHESGQLALVVLMGATYFSNFEIHTTPDAPFERHLPAMPPATLTRWSLSPALDALTRDLEKPLTAEETKGMTWQDVEAEPPGIVPINRWRPSPHPRVTFATDFSKRLDPQPGTKVVYARTTIESDRDQVKRLWLGYSDDVTVFLNGRPLYRGRSPQNFRDPAFLGIVNPENDAVFLPLRKGTNELVLALAELGGGWGFVCRLTDGDNARP